MVRWDQMIHSAAATDLTPDIDVEAGLAASIRSNYLGQAMSAMIFAHLAIVVVSALLWTHVETTSLMVWAAGQSTLMLTSMPLTRIVAPSRFLPTAIAGEALRAVWWATLPLFALPDSADWQVMEGLLLASLMLASLGNTTATRSLHLAATAPLAVISAAAFTFRGTGAAQWLGVAFAVGLPFTLAAGAVVRQIQAELFQSSLRNENLAKSLRAEGNRLKDANAQLETAISHLDTQSRLDTLTGLYNRAGFLDLLNRAVTARPGTIVVCYLDLDGFKRVNDAFGHRFGDMILCAAARRLTRVMLPNEVVARQGGDEMTIFASIDELPDGLEGLGRRILSVFDDPFLIENRQVEMSVSVGLVWLPEPTSADDLMRFADTALYKAKELGRNRLAVFDDSMRVELERRTKLQSDLSLAFDRSEIIPYFQPIVEISSGKIATAEALARWERADGVRPASDFIDTARDLGMLDRINDVVTRKVFEFNRTLAAGPEQTVPITVNVSPLHLDAMLNRVINEPDAGSIIIEITEDGDFSDLTRARRQLQRAHAAGIKVLLDDFGVGLSSLSVATELPIDGFKIDRGFIASLAGNPSAVAAVESIMGLARRLGLQVVAEGVETAEQLELLRTLGVEYAQGYLFSEAVPAATLAGWIRSGHRFGTATPTARALVR